MYIMNRCPRPFLTVKHYTGVTQGNRPLLTGAAWPGYSNPNSQENARTDKVKKQQAGGARVE